MPSFPFLPVLVTLGVPAIVLKFEATGFATVTAWGLAMTAGLRGPVVFGSVIGAGFWGAAAFLAWRGSLHPTPSFRATAAAPPFTRYPAVLFGPMV